MKKRQTMESKSPGYLPEMQPAGAPCGCTAITDQQRQDVDEDDRIYIKELYLSLSCIQGCLDLICW